MPKYEVDILTTMRFSSSHLIDATTEDEAKSKAKDLAKNIPFADLESEGDWDFSVESVGVAY